MKDYISNETLLLQETLYSTANGYIGIRANFEEGYNNTYDTIRGTYINGFYENHSIDYGESAVGFPKEGQRMVNVFDGQGVRIRVDGEMFSVFSGHLKKYDRGLNTEEGYAYRHVKWQSDKGHKFRISFKRMTSFDIKEMVLFQVSIESLNYDGPIDILSSVKGDVSNYTSKDDPRVADNQADLLELSTIDILGNTVVFGGKAIKSGNTMALTVGHNPPIYQERVGQHTEGVATFDIHTKETICFEKYLVYTDSIRHDAPYEDGLKILDEVLVLGAAKLFDMQRTYIQQFWQNSEVVVSGDDKVSEAVRYSLYQLLASAGTEKMSQIAAKGLSGEGYEGHYFWDTEIYMIPFFTLTQPHIAKKLLTFRYETLGAARARAGQMGHRNCAKIPWRTISGHECSAYFPAGSAQYHINADVAYAVIQYFLCTNDVEFIETMGLELLVETGKIWLEIGHYDSDGRFVICDVTGPDEYTAIVNNNYYTNVMAKYHMEWVVKLCKLMKSSHIDMTMLEAFSNAAAHMYLPFDSRLNINAQDDSFLQKKVWDLDEPGEKKRPLLLHYHPLTIYRHQILKQADVVLAHFLLDSEQESVMKASYDYYEQLTTHDSSLSPCVYGMMATKIGNVDKAYQYFMKTIRLDLDNLHHNTKDGLHIANAGGVYMSLVYGFGGLRIKEDGLHFKPEKPKQWTSIKFNVIYQGNRIEVLMGKTIKFVVEAPVELQIYDRTYHVQNVLEVAYD